MSGSRFLINLAVSLFLAPLPALAALGWLAGDGGVPIWLGLAAMVLSAAVYWAVLVRLRRAPRQAAATTAAEDPAPGTALVLRGQDRVRAPEPQPARAEPHDRHRAHDVRSYEDLPDPLAEQRGLRPAEVLIDRVSDITQVKRLVEANKVHLMTAWYRQVRDSATGDREYGDWALEADRLLLSASFMTRTMTRHEAIALVTAEVAARVEARRTAEEEARHGGGRHARAPEGRGYAAQPGYAAGSGYAAEPGHAYGMSHAPAAGRASSSHCDPSAGAHGWQGGGWPAQASWAHPGAAPTMAPGVGRAEAVPAAEPQVLDAEPASAPATLEPLLHGMATAAGTTAARSAPGQGVVRTLPQVVLRRCRTLLDCGGWRTSTDAEATAEGIDIFAEREGRVVGLRVISGDDRATPETVAVAAHAGTMFGTDLVALVAQGGFDRSTRAAATHAGVLLLEDGDLADLATFLPASAHDRGGPGQRAAAE